MVIDLLRSSGGSIFVNKKLAHAIGLDAAIMYSELVNKEKYFADNNMLTEDAFFFNTVENMLEDTTLSKHQQLKAIKKLVELKLIFHENRGLPQRRYFKINVETRYIKKILEANNSISKSQKSEQLIGEKVNSNNNKENNNKKNIYRISDENAVFDYYSQKYKEKFGDEHPKMIEEKMDELIISYYHLESNFDIDKESWLELIDYHFNNLSPNNNGNILSFLALNGGHGCVYRYLEDLSD